MISSLTAEKLACVRGDRRVFADLDFQVAAGEALVVEGANGAGKTSLLRLIAGFLPPASGSVTLKTDSDTHQRWRGARPPCRLAGPSGRHQAATERGRAAGILRASVWRRGRRSRRSLERVGLARQRELPCRYLSAGQKKRLGLARLIVSGRGLWLLDEPFAALDSAGRALAAELMRAHCSSGGIVVAATHDALGR